MKNPAQRATTAGAAPARRSNALVLLGLALFTLYSVAPVWWLLVSVTKNQRDLLYSNGLWFADFNLLDNLRQVLRYNDGIFFRWLLNSLLYAGVGALVCTVVAIGAGYALSRFRFFGRGVALGAVIGSFLIPYAMLTLPLYLLFSRIGLVNSVWAVLIPSFVSPFSVYLAKVYVDGAIPVELIEAARIDGAGELRIFGQIVLRMMTTGGATVFLLAFVQNWNQFFLPLTMLRGEEQWTLSLGLFAWNAKRDEAEIDLSALVLTGSLLSIVPLAVFMVAMQRYWRTGVTLGSLK
ncbi:ABC transporter permease subunit [Streptomyces sp. 3MP-14]|uniref:ABC transporter permease subunit n=1 Tax=Streptomyces mimosae TaxID=2586635 RepID=A0A5N6A126_9ACTN|nr:MULTISPECIES: carbohydrate ABC transporter permease [Streptomyces]KAB8161912.1 ABC transporter permease subunit [Streptomyces mimosae]KAB8173610.1 ABC transporter permease subunit [Streptomyces sp. 3MP-14]